MLVVSDTSPISALVRIGHADLLPRLFNEVIIPPQVQLELTHPRAPDVVRSFIKQPPHWLKVEAPKCLVSIPHLDPGEVAAISLAQELAALLLIDDKDGRRAATERGIAITGTVGIIERAAMKGLGRVEEFVGALVATGFFIDPSVVENVIRRAKRP